MTATATAPTAPAAPAAPAQPNGAPKPGASTPEARASSALPPPGTLPGKAGKPPQQAKPEGESPAGDGGAPKEEEGPLFEVDEDGVKRQYTREQAIRELQKRGASGKKWREAQEVARKSQQLVELLKNPERFEEVATQLGHNLDDIAKRRLQKAVEHAQLSEDQQENLRLKQQLEKHEGEAKKREAAAAKAQQAAEDEAAFAHFEKGFVTAAEKHGIEGTPANLERMVEIASEFHDLGVPFTEDQVCAELKEREDAAFSKLEARVLKGLKGEALAKRLGPVAVEEILRWSVEKIRGGPPAPAAAKAEAPPAEKAKNPYVSESEFRKKHGF